MERRLWLLRHGETDANLGGIFQGQTDVALNERGIEQAALVADRLATIGFHRIYSSDLSRAGRTAELIAERQRASVIYDRNLREMHYGVLQGVRYDDAAAVLAERGVADAWVGTSSGYRTAAPAGGESARMVRNRASRFLRRIDADSTSSDDGDASEILIVAHGGQLRIMLTVLLGVRLAQRSQFAFANCGLSRVSERDENRILDFHNIVLWNAEQFIPRH